MLANQNAVDLQKQHFLRSYGEFHNCFETDWSDDLNYFHMYVCSICTYVCALHVCRIHDWSYTQLRADMWVLEIEP